jgi:elongation factor Tu
MRRTNERKPDFIAEVSYLSTEEGGRRSYAASGYRPHLKFEGSDYLTSGEQHFPDREKVLPGETATAEISILSVEVFKNKLFVGQPFEFSEGGKLIGRGRIVEIVNSDLQKPV